MTGRPDQPLPAGWNDIPGARGCTPQSCSYRDHMEELKTLGAQVYGVSTQTSEYQLEAKTRLQLPFELLSDASHRLCQTLSLPTLLVEDKLLIKRLTMIIVDGTIRQVFYPVFPSSEDASNVLQWLESHQNEITNG